MQHILNHFRGAPRKFGRSLCTCYESIYRQQKAFEKNSGESSCVPALKQTKHLFSNTINLIDLVFICQRNFLKYSNVLVATNNNNDNFWGSMRIFENLPISDFCRMVFIQQGQCFTPDLERGCVCVGSGGGTIEI